MGVNSLPKTVARQRRGCDLNPGPSAPESSTLTTRLPMFSVGAVASDASAASCEGGVIYNSTCYTVHRDTVDWYSARDRCRRHSDGGSLAVFDDDVRSYFASSLLMHGPVWIGLAKSCCTWPDQG